MNAFISHIDVMPLFYGLIIFVGIATIVWKIARGRIFKAALEIAVFILVFHLHQGTLTGGLSATVAALAAGLFLPAVIKFAWRSNFR